MLAFVNQTYPDQRGLFGGIRHNRKSRGVINTVINELRSTEMS